VGGISGPQSNDGGGGGGRIAVHADNVETLDRAQFNVSGGDGTTAPYNGYPGTIVWFDKDVNDLYAVNNFRFQTNDFSSVSTYNRIVFLGAEVGTNMSSYHPTFNVAHWIMDENSSLTGEVRQGFNVTINASVNVSLNDVAVSRFEVYSPVVGILSTGTIDGDRRGYAATEGPGTATGDDGGAYGGAGGGPTGSYYGSALVPDNMGSGSLNRQGAGYVKIVSVNFTHDGVISLVGGSASDNQGGGAGGGIFVNATNIYGDGTYTAVGGNSGSNSLDGGGGGGRIAIHANNVEALNRTKFNVSGGYGQVTSTDGEPGTIVWKDTADNIIYPQYGFRAETEDSNAGLLRAAAFIAENVSLLRLGTNAWFNMTDNFTMRNSNIAQTTNPLQVIAPLIILNESKVNSTVLDFRYDALQDLNAEYPSTVTSLRLGKPGASLINWTSSVTDIFNLSTAVRPSNRSAYVDSQQVSGLNTTAQITFLGIDFLDPVVDVDFNDDGVFEICQSPQCTKVSYDNASGVYVFNVSRFTNYTIRENNTAPLVANVTLNSTLGTNLTSENVTVWYDVADGEGDPVKNITNWYVDGSSIAVLNMPFEAINSTTIDNAHDYSGLGNDGIIVNATWNETGGYDGRGAYEFDGDGYINVSVGNSMDFGTGNFTLMAWVKFSNFDNNMYFLSKGTNNDNRLLFAYYQPQDFLQLYSTVGGTVQINLRKDGVSLQPGRWYHLAVSYTGSNTSEIYVDGLDYDNYDQTIFTGGSTDTNGSFYIGSQHGQVSFHNGSIDEVLVFNRSLSGEQIQALYQNRTDVIVSQETNKGETWEACVTPNDGVVDGAEVCSNNLTILNSIPLAPNLTRPEHGNDSIIDRTPELMWNNSYDADNDALTYHVVLDNNNDFSSPIVNVSNVTEGTTTTSYTVSTLLDVDTVYYWKVRASDGSSNGSYSTTFNFTVTSYLAAGFSQPNISFSTMQPGFTNSTDDFNPLPMVLENIGNVFLNVTLFGSQLFQSESVSFPSDNYQFKVALNESGSFNTSLSTTSYVNVTNVSTRTDIAIMGWEDENDTARVHVNVTVPGDEPAGNRTSTMVVSVS